MKTTIIKIFFIFLATVLLSAPAHAKEKDLAAKDWDLQGLTHYNNNELEEAVEAFSRSIELNPYFLTYASRGFVYLKLKRYQNVIDDFTEAIAQVPGEPDFYKIRGSSYFELKQYESAKDDFSKAIELSPTDFLPYGGRGIIYLLQKEYDKAVKDFEKAFKLQPEYELNRLQLAEAYIVNGQAKQSIRLHSNVEYQPKHEAIAYYLIIIAEKLIGMDTTDSEHQFLSALKANPKHTWNAVAVEDWLETAEISQDKKDFIKELTRYLNKNKKEL